MALRGLPAILRVWDRIIKESGLERLSLHLVRDPLALVTPDNTYPAKYAIVDMEHFHECNALVGYLGEGDDCAVFMLRTIPCDYAVPYSLRDKWAVRKVASALKAIRIAFRFECQYGLRFLLLPVFGVGYDGINRIYGVQQM